MRTKKRTALRVFVSFALAVMVLFAIVPVSAQAKEITVTINGQRVSFSGQGPVVVDGRTLVPVRPVFEALGFTVSWFPDQGVVEMRRSADLLTIWMQIGNTTFAQHDANNSRDLLLDVPPQIIGGSTMFVCLWRAWGIKWVGMQA